jgi:hypothetical protein
MGAVRRLTDLSLGLTLLLVPSCASYRGGELPLRSAAELEGLAALPGITFELETFRGSISAGSVDPRSRIEPLLRRAFAAVREVTTADEARGELHLDLLVREAPRNPGLTLGLGILWLGSLGLIPAYARDDLLLDARLVRGAETLASYVYEDHVETWLSFVLLPWSFERDPEFIHAQVLDGMVLALIADLRRDLPHLGSVSPH